MTALSVSRITTRLGDRPVLQDVSFAADGGLIGLVGPNGCGKSTLLRTLLGLVKPERGGVRWYGRMLDAWDRAALARKVGYLPQGAVCHWPMRVRDVVALGRYPFGASGHRLGAEDEAAIVAALAATGTEGFADRPVTQLSGGERGRVLLARVLAGQPTVILADEPGAGLDPHYQLQIMTVLRQHARDGRAGIVVLHDLALALRFCDRVIFLNAGRVVADGPASDTITSDRIAAVFGVRAAVLSHEGTPCIALKEIA